MSKTLPELNNYLKKIEVIIRTNLTKPNRDVFTYDILDTVKTTQNKLIVLREKQRQMAIGKIWQEIIGNYKDCIDLGNGRDSGLDIRSDKRKFIIELKNRTNTDNSSSRKANLDKLARFKREHPDYTCIYACINDSTEKKTMKGSIKKITHKDTELEHHIGYAFLKFIFGKDTDEILSFIRKTIDECS